MKNLLPFFLLIILLGSTSFAPPWGFFGHRRINRLAVFTLPPEMIVFYKKHIEYITEHAVDPDKRRYATRHEAVRHYIDIDHWGTYPFSELPRDWTEALMKYTDLFIVRPGGDTLQILGNDLVEASAEAFHLRSNVALPDHPLMENPLPGKKYREFFVRRILPQYYEETWVLDCGQVSALLQQDIPCESAFAVDRFSEYGIVPYHLLNMQNQLTEAFRQKNVSRILRLSAEMGHYIGDAHVPLHATENYNGQLTGQVGIHAFWESRIPELFADKEYDFFVGKATYIDDPKNYFWEVVLQSAQMVDSVLTIEKELSRTFPADKQYCYEERLGITVRTQCKEYAAAYQEKLNGQVERRMRETILAVGCSWYTAWVDAGQPDLSLLAGPKASKQELKEQESLEVEYKKGTAKGRKHDG